MRGMKEKRTVVLEGGPLDGTMRVIHEGSELVVQTLPNPPQATRAMAPGEADKPVEVVEVRYVRTRRKRGGAEVWVFRGGHSAPPSRRGPGRLIIALLASGALISCAKPASPPEPTPTERACWSYTTLVSGETLKVRGSGAPDISMALVRDWWIECDIEVSDRRPSP